MIIMTTMTQGIIYEDDDSDSHNYNLQWPWWFMRMTRMEVGSLSCLFVLLVCFIRSLKPLLVRTCKVWRLGVDQVYTDPTDGGLQDPSLNQPGFQEAAQIVHFPFRLESVGKHLKFWWHLQEWNFTTCFWKTGHIQKRQVSQALFMGMGLPEISVS